MPFAQDRFHHPAVVLFEEIFCFKTGSGFATSIAQKVLDLGIWTALLENKRAYADKPLDERKRIANWILDEYEKRVSEKKNGTNRTANGYKQTPAEIIASRPYYQDTD